MHRPTIAFVLGGVVLAGLALYFVQYLFRTQDENIHAAISALSVLRSQSNMRPALEERLKNSQRILASMPGLFVSENAVLAGAQLQRDMKALVEANGGQVRATQALPVSFTEGYESISAQYDVTLPVSRIKDLLYAVDDHKPYLFFDTLSITGPRDWPRGADKRTDAQLDMHWVVHGFRRANTK